MDLAGTRSHGSSGMQPNTFPSETGSKGRNPKYTQDCVWDPDSGTDENGLLDPLCHTILCIPSKEISDPSVSPPSTNTADSAADIKIPRLSGQLSGIHPGAFYKCASDLQEVDHQQSDTTTSAIVIMPGHRYSPPSHKKKFLESF